MQWYYLTNRAISYLYLAILLQISSRAQYFQDDGALRPENRVVKIVRRARRTHGGERNCQEEAEASFIIIMYRLY